MSRLKENLQNKKFVITCEVNPPKGIDLTECIGEAQIFKEFATAVNVTDSPGANLKISNIAVCKELINHDIEPVYQITCRDRNRIALQADLLCASYFGIENILCLTGDPPHIGDHPQAKPVYDFDVAELMRTCKKLNEGFDQSGNQLNSKPNLFIGAAVTPEADSLDLELKKMEKKVESGADFFQTQAIFNPDKFFEFMKTAKKFNKPIIAGIVLLKSEKMANFMNKNIPGIKVPDCIIQDFKKTKDKVQKCIEVAYAIINAIKNECQGVHIMPLGWGKYVPDIISKLKLDVSVY